MNNAFIENGCVYDLCSVDLSRQPTQRLERFIIISGIAYGSSCFKLSETNSEVKFESDIKQINFNLDDRRTSLDEDNIFSISFGNDNYCLKKYFIVPPKINPMTISVNCINFDRLSFLIKTVSHNLSIIDKYKNIEFNLLSWGDSAEEMSFFSSIPKNKINIYVDKNRKNFSMAKMRNHLNAISTGQIIIALDADNFLTSKYINDVIETHYNTPGCIGRCGDFRDCFGRISADRSDVVSVNGYDENFTYGYGDCDLVQRLLLNGSKMTSKITACGLAYIGHSDECRIKHDTKGNMSQVLTSNFDLYLKNKIEKVTYVNVDPINCDYLRSLKL